MAVGGAALGVSQDAYFTFTNRSPNVGEQGLLLKYSGGANPNSTSAQWIEVAVTNAAGTVVVRTKSGRQRSRLS